MRSTTAGVAGRQPLRSRRDDLDDTVGYRRGELAAGLATAAIVGQLLFAQVTLLAAAVLVVAGRASRWRPHWLAAPAFASFIWLLAIGPGGAVAAYATGQRRLARYLLAAAVHPGLLAHPGVVLAGAGRWLPSELPLALLAACGEAGFALWFGWWRLGAPSQSRWQWRPGVVALVRRRFSVAALAAGHSVTSDGAAVGVSTGTGKLASLSWAEAMDGVLLAGQDVDLIGLAIVSAALRRRKTVLILECAGRPGGVTGRVRDLGALLGMPVRDVSGAAVSGDHGTAVTRVGAASSVASGGGFGAGSVAAAVGRAIRRREALLIVTAPGEAAQRAADGLAAVLVGLCDLGLRADCLTWISGCEFMNPARLSELLDLGPLTGTAMVLSTTSASHAAALAPAVAVVTAGGPINADLAAALAANAQGGLLDATAIGRESGSHALLGAADPTSRPTASAAKPFAGAADRTFTDILASQRSGEFTMLAYPAACDSRSRVTTRCQAVPITVGHPE